MRTATRKVEALYDAALSPVGINVAQLAVLRTVARRQPVSLTELARHLDLDRSTMGRNVRVLERLGLVSLGRGRDQREATVTVSDQGGAVLRAAQPLWERCQDEIGERLGPARIEVLGELGSLL